MIFGIAIRLGVAAVALAAAGLYALWQNAQEGEETERGAQPPRDTYVKSPPPDAGLAWQRSQPNGNLGLFQSPISRQAKQMLREKLNEAGAQDVPTPAESESEGEAAFMLPADPVVTPKKVTERSMKTYHVEELLFPDGSLEVRLSNRDEATSRSVAFKIPPEKMPTYYEKASQVINGCEPLPSGDAYCYNYFPSLDITDCWFQDAQGNIYGWSGRLGRWTSYEIFLKDDDSNYRSEIIEGGVRFIDHE